MAMLLLFKCTFTTRVTVNFKDLFSGIKHVPFARKLLYYKSYGAPIFLHSDKGETVFKRVKK